VLPSQDATEEPDKAPLCPGSKSAAEPPPIKADSGQLHKCQKVAPEFPQTPNPVKERPRGGYVGPQASEPQKGLDESIRDDRALEEYDVFCKPKQGSEKEALPGKLRIWEGGRVMINCLCQDCSKVEGEVDFNLGFSLEKVFGLIAQSEEAAYVKATNGTRSCFRWV
jgi:hypothetical protein